MGIIDRRYSDDIPKKCPKTGHWTGVSNCSECDYNYCPVRKLPFTKHTDTHKLSSLYNFNVAKKDKPSEVPKLNVEPTADNKSGNLTPIEMQKKADNKTTNTTGKGQKTDINQIVGGRLIPKWLETLLLIFACSIIGMVLNIAVHNSIPFYLLLGFSVIFSGEKWFSYDTRKHKLLGKLYRLILNLGMLSLLGLLIWSGIKLFSHQFVQSALVGSILFVAEFVFFIWAWRVIAKNSWRWPSMKLTVFALICLFLVFAFGGVQPMSSYKDTALNKIQDVFSNGNNNQPTTTYSNNLTATSLRTTASVVTIPHTNVINTPSQTITTLQNIIKGINSKTGVYKNYYLAGC